VDWHEKARSLAEQLTASGELRDPNWRVAFENIPRHVFVPGFSLDEAYADEALVTQRRTAPVVGGDGVELPTSSASQPGVVAAMLERLNVNSDMRVLEIGTGTGYNAALLSHRLGDGNVYSIDLDPELVAQAGAALTGVGFEPHLRAGDGCAGWPEHSPFHRIIATCAVDHIPPAWIDQLVQGGQIVAPLLGDECALMVLDKIGEGEVIGRLDPYRTSFMPLRDQIDTPLGAGRRQLGLATAGIGQYGTTDLDPAAFDHTDQDLLLLLHLHLPGLSIGSAEGPDGKHLTLSTSDATAQVALLASAEGRHVTIQHGRRLWDTAEHVARLWDLLDHPGRDRYGISAMNDTHRQYVWLDDPDGAYAWPMPL
jgi:protein-L-isoaspartate(D-aspartate) O-methyltransferase